MLIYLEIVTVYRGEGFMIQYKVNVFGVVNVTNAFLPYMRARKEGTIVMMGSRSGWRRLEVGCSSR